MPSRGQKVKSEVAPDLKVTFMIHANHVPSFMLLSQSAKRECLAALLYFNVSFSHLVIFKHFSIFLIKDHAHLADIAY